MVDEEDRQPVGVEALDQLAHALLFGRVHPRGGLVEDQEAWPQRERARDLEAPLVAVGQRRGVARPHRAR